MNSDSSYKNRKVISIGVVKELTGLSERQIRYYEERNLIFPERTEKGSRKYSFFDVERLVEIANQREEGVSTDEIRRDINKRDKEKLKKEDIRKDMLKGQLNARFGIQKK